MARSASLDSISTSVSLRTQQSAAASTLPQSPSMDTIQRHKHRKPTLKDEKGNMYTLLETASTDCEIMPVAPTTEPEERGERHKVAAPDKSSERGNDGQDSSESTAKRNSLTASLPTEVDKCVPVRTGGVSTRTATELARRKDPDANVSIQSRIWVKKLMAVWYPPCLWLQEFPFVYLPPTLCIHENCWEGS